MVQPSGHTLGPSETNQVTKSEKGTKKNKEILVELNFKRRDGERAIRMHYIIYG